VASAIFQGVDAVMLSAESASGKYRWSRSRCMDRIIARSKATPITGCARCQPEVARANPADAVCAALRQTAHIVSAKATITYTSSGFSAMRAARERPEAPILSRPESAHRRRCACVGMHFVQSGEVMDVNSMTDLACDAALREGFAAPGDYVVIAAGVPFRHLGTTNLLRIARPGTLTTAHRSARRSTPCGGGRERAARTFRPTMNDTYAPAIAPSPTGCCTWERRAGPCSAAFARRHGGQFTCGSRTRTWTLHRRKRAGHSDSMGGCSWSFDEGRCGRPRALRATPK